MARAINNGSTHGNDRNFHGDILISGEKTACYEQAAQLPNLLIDWVFIANGKRAQIFACRKAMQKIPLWGSNKQHYFEEKPWHELMPVPNGIMEAEFLGDYHPASNGLNPAHNTYDQRGGIQEELKRRFIMVIVIKLQQAYAMNSFDRLVLMAPSKMIGELRGQLSADVRNRIVGVLPKDFKYYQDRVVITRMREMPAEDIFDEWPHQDPKAAHHIHPAGNAKPA